MHYIAFMAERFFAKMHLNAGEKLMYNLTLQIFAAGQWHDAMILSFADPEKGRITGAGTGRGDQTQLVDAAF